MCDSEAPELTAYVLVAPPVLRAIGMLQVPYLSAGRCRALLKV